MKADILHIQLWTSLGKLSLHYTLITILKFDNHVDSFNPLCHISYIVTRPFIDNIEQPNKFSTFPIASMKFF